MVKLSLGCGSLCLETKSAVLAVCHVGGELQLHLGHYEVGESLQMSKWTGGILVLDSDIVKSVLVVLKVEARV